MFFKRMVIKTVDFLLLVTSGVLKFLLKVQLKMKNKQPDYYANLRSSLEKELTSDLMPLESKYKEEIQRSSARGSAMRAFREDIAKLSNVKTEDYEMLALKHSLEDSFNSGSKYSEIMNKICFIEDAALRASDTLLSNDLKDMCCKDERDENKFGNLTFDKRRRAVYLLNKIRRDEIREAAKKCKMFFASKFNEELEKTESPIDDISCDVGVRDTDVATVTRGSY